MILPTKHISTEFSLVGIGASILSRLHGHQTVSSVWELAKDDPGVATFERFTMALSLLYALGLVEYRDGFLQRAEVSA